MSTFKQTCDVFCSGATRPQTSAQGPRLVLDQPGSVAAFGQCLDAISVAGLALVVTVQQDGSVALWVTSGLRFYRQFFWSARRERIIDADCHPVTSAEDFDAVLSARFRRPDGALVLGTHAGHVVCIEHGSGGGLANLYRRWQLVGRLDAPVWLVGSAAPTPTTPVDTTAANNGDGDQGSTGAALSTGAPGESHTRPLPASVSVSEARACSPLAAISTGVVVAWTEHALWWYVPALRRWHRCPHPEDFEAQQQQQQQQQRIRDAPAIYLGEVSASGCFFAWTLRHSDGCWIGACPQWHAATFHAASDTDTNDSADDNVDQRMHSEAVFIHTSDPLCSLAWKPAPIRGGEALLVGDRCGRLRLFSAATTDWRSIATVSGMPLATQAVDTAACFVHQYGSGGIAEDENDAALVVLSEWHLGGAAASGDTRPHAKRDAQSAQGIIVHPYRASIAVHYIGQWIPGMPTLWCVSHLNDEPVPRVVPFHRASDGASMPVAPPETDANVARNGPPTPVLESVEGAAASTAACLAVRIEAAAESWRAPVSAACAPAKELRSQQPPAQPAQLNWILQRGQVVERWYQNGRPGDALEFWSHVVRLGNGDVGSIGALSYGSRARTLVALTSTQRLVCWPLPGWPALRSGYGPRTLPTLTQTRVSRPGWVHCANQLTACVRCAQRVELALFTMTEAGLLQLYGWLSPPEVDARETQARIPDEATAAPLMCVLSASTPPGVQVDDCAVWSRHQPQMLDTLEADQPQETGLLCWSALDMVWYVSRIIGVRDANATSVAHSVPASIDSETGDAAIAPLVPCGSATPVQAAPACNQYQPEEGQATARASSPARNCRHLALHCFDLSPWVRLCVSDPPPCAFAVRTDKVFVWRVDGVLAVYRLDTSRSVLERITASRLVAETLHERAHWHQSRLVVSADAQEVAVWDAASRRLHLCSFDGADIYALTTVDVSDTRPDADISFARYRSCAYLTVDRWLYYRRGCRWISCGQLPGVVHHTISLPEGVVVASRNDQLFVFDASMAMSRADQETEVLSADARYEMVLMAGIGAGLAPDAAMRIAQSIDSAALAPGEDTGTAADATAHPESVALEQLGTARSASPDPHAHCAVDREHDGMPPTVAPLMRSVDTGAGAGAFARACHESFAAHARACAALDANGSVFVILADAYRRLNLEIPPQVLQFALHATCEEAILQELGLLSGSVKWHMARQYGCGYWVRSELLIHRLVEVIARATYNASHKPRDAVLWYVLLRRPRVLSTLFRAIGEPRIAGFFAQDFGDAAVRERANKNAFARLAVHDYELSAAFFILGADPSAAMQVIRDRLGDEQLALLLSRLEPTLQAEQALENAQEQQQAPEWQLLRACVIGKYDHAVAIVERMDWLRNESQASAWPAMAGALLQTRALQAAPSVQRRPDFIGAHQRLRFRVGHLLAQTDLLPLAQRLVHPAWRIQMQSHALGQALLRNSTACTLARPALRAWVQQTIAVSEEPLPEHALESVLVATGKWLLHQDAPRLLGSLNAWIVIRQLLESHRSRVHRISLDEGFLDSILSYLVATIHRIALGVSDPDEDISEPQQQQHVWLMDAAVLTERLQAASPPVVPEATRVALSQAAQVARFLWIWRHARWTPINAMHASWCDAATRMQRTAHVPAKAIETDTAIEPRPPSVPCLPRRRQRAHCLSMLHALCLVDALDRCAVCLQKTTTAAAALRWATALRTAIHLLIERIAGAPGQGDALAGRHQQQLPDGDEEAVEQLWRRCWLAGGWVRTQLARALLADHAAEAVHPASCAAAADGVSGTTYPLERTLYPVRFSGAGDSTVRRSQIKTRHSVLLREATLMTALAVAPHEPTRLVVATLKPHRGLYELSWEPAEGVSTDGESERLPRSSPSSASAVVRDLRAGNWHGRVPDARHAEAAAASRGLRWRSEVLASSLAAHPFSNRYISGDTEGDLLFWTFGEPFALAQLTWAHARGQVVQRVRFAPFGDAVVAAYASGLVALWRVPDKLAICTPSEPEQVWRPFGDVCVHDVCFVDQENVIATFGRAYDGSNATGGDTGPSRMDTIRVFDLRAGALNPQQQQQQQRYHHQPVLCFRAHTLPGGDSSVRGSSSCESLCGLVLGDGTRLLSASSEGHLAVCDMRTSRCAAQFRAHSDGSAIRTLVMEEPRGRALITGTDSGQVRLWDARSLRLLEELGTVHRPTRHFRARARASQHASSLRLSGGTALFGLYGVECALLTDYSLITGGGDGYLYAHGPGWGGTASPAVSDHVSTFADDVDTQLRRVESGLALF